MTRELHPGAWWVWALALAAAATRTTNPWLLTILALVACVTVLARRTDAPWALSFRLYLWLAALVVGLRVLFRVLFAGSYGGHVLMDLPGIPLPHWAAGVTLLGPVTSEALLSGLYDGMRLAAILVCVGAANALANPKHLLAALPAALYEVGTALVVALSVFPQLAESVQRVRRARRLRGDDGRRVAGVRRVAVPVLEDALDRSIALAASMDARGYGRSGSATPWQRHVTGSLLVSALLAMCVGSYATLDSTAPRILALPLLLLSLVLTAVGFRLAGRRVQRTRYRTLPWGAPEWVTAGSGVSAAALLYVAATLTPSVVLPEVSTAPALSVLALLGAVAGVLPALFGRPAS